MLRFEDLLLITGLTTYSLAHRLLEDHGLGAAPDSGLNAIEKEAVEIELKYAGLAARQEKAQAQIAAKHSRRIPEGLDYHTISTLSKEAREKLTRVSA